MRRPGGKFPRVHGERNENAGKFLKTVKTIATAKNVHRNFGGNEKSIFCFHRF